MEGLGPLDTPADAGYSGRTGYWEGGLLGADGVKAQGGRCESPGLIAAGTPLVCWLGLLGRRRVRMLGWRA